MRLMILTAAVTLLAIPASAASLLTSNAGYTGPTLDTGGLGEPFYLFTTGPVSLPGGITYSSPSSNSVIGIGGYYFNDNGATFTTPIVGTNGEDGTTAVTLTFDTPVAMFGGGFQYAVTRGVPFGDAPTISAYDSSNNLIASYDLLALAPIGFGIDYFEFRGIDGGGIGIKSFVLSGSYIVMSANSTVVPEAATWAMMIAGFGLVGASLRRRQAAIA